MKAFLLASLPALLLLSACGKSGTDAGSAADTTTGPAMSANEVAAKMDAVKLAPGQWEATQEIVNVKMSGMPGSAASDTNGMNGRRTSTKYCLTPEQAANPGAQFLGAQKDAQCDNQKMTMSGGKINVEMNCAMPQKPDAKVHMVMAGTYLPDHYDADMTVDTSGLPNGMSMAMKMKISAKRIGDCPAAAAK